MEGILHAASEVKELLVHEADKLHLHGNKDSSSSSSSSDEEDEAAKFPRIESAVVALNEKLSSSSSSSSSSSDDEASPAENIIIPSTVLDPVEDSAPVAVSEAETIVAESYEKVSNGVEVEATAELEKVVIDESESSENDEKVLPIEEEEETVMAADSLETGYLVSKETEESGSGSAVEEHSEIPVSSGSPVLITTVTHQVRSPTSWMSCCGLFDVLKRDK